jgi:Thioredoxin-like
MTRYAAIVGVLLFSCASCERPHPIDISGSAEILRDKALAQARKENKQVFVLFTSPACGWCQRFAEFHSDPEVRGVIEKHLVLLPVDIVETPGGEQMYMEHGTLRGVPAFSIISGHGMLLANSGDGEENLGFPVKPHEVEGYFAALKKSCPKFTDAEAELLRAKLDRLRPTEDPSQ